MMTLEEIAAKVDGLLTGEGGTVISGISAIQEAKEGAITFLLGASYVRYVEGCEASGIIVGQDVPLDAYPHKNFIVVKNPSLAYARAAKLFERPLPGGEGISSLAFVSSGAQVAENVTIHPYVYVEEKAVIERDAVIFPFAYVGEGVHVGEGAVIYPNVTLYRGTRLGKRVVIHSGTVVGSDGFGYVWDGGQHQKIPQLGIVEIEDDVEIGANTSVDRASLGCTVIKRGAKIDNQVQIGHNVSIGEHSIIVSQVGIAGSTTVGRNTILAGQVGVRDHVAIGNNVRAAGGTGITKDVPDNATISGTPHMAHREWLKLQAYLKKLPKLFETVARLEKQAGKEVPDDRNR